MFLFDFRKHHYTDYSSDQAPVACISYFSRFSSFASLLFFLESFAVICFEMKAIAENQAPLNFPIKNLYILN